MTLSTRCTNTSHSIRNPQNGAISLISVHSWQKKHILDFYIVKLTERHHSVTQLSKTIIRARYNRDEEIHTIHTQTATNSLFYLAGKFSCVIAGQIQQPKGLPMKTLAELLRRIFTG